MNTFINPITACDFYKVGHKAMYPNGLTKIYSNFTPRSNNYAANKDSKIVFFGLQGFVKWFLVDAFQKGFFDQPLGLVISEYDRRNNTSLGQGSVDSSHIAALHKLGYLPIQIKALPEGSLVPTKVPVMTIANTHPDFGWLPNYLETALSAELWKSCTTATTAYEYRKLIQDYATKTGSPLDFVLWQGHDFSLRGLSGLHDASSAAGHLLSFLGTDTIPAIDYLERYYNARDSFVGGSVPASEHSVMSAGGKDTELETYRRLITEVCPSGVVSIVSDTWDFWHVITETAAALKQEILDRKPNELGLAKVVFRPDSGDPVDILCGDPTATTGSPAYKGAVECLWDTFGGTVTDKGFKVLNQRVGLIYGDSITLDRANRIMKRLADKGFASCNTVFGVGSYTYQYVTRDTHGFAMKATYCEIDGVGQELFKDPVTDTGVKKSAKGLLRVEREGDTYVLYDQQTVEQETQGCLQTVFLNGKLVIDDSLDNIRARVELTLK
jgi:nicotinamide phosphoribosyltransferase